MPKDFLVFGGLAGIAGNIVKELFTWSLYWLGLLNYTFLHICAGIVISPIYLRHPLALFIGFIIDNAVAASFGIIFYYVYRRTGAAYFLLKGIGFGMIVFLICYGVLCPFLSLRISPPPLIVFFYLIANIIYGLVMGLFVKRFSSK